MRRLLTILVGAALLALVGCGSDDEAKKGGTLTVLSEGDVDSLDPGYMYYQYDYQVVSQPGHRALYGWKGGETKPVPDFAQGAPQVTDGGKTVTIKLRRGVKFSPPVNREANSSDVKYALERIFLPQVGNGYASVYFGNLVGVDEYTDGKAKEIKGIETPDPQTLVLKFSKPSGVVATAEALTLPGTAPVPKDYAEKYDKGETSTYGQHAVYTGPYMIPSDKSGKATGYKPGKRIELVRNPNWDAKTDFRPAHVDKILALGGNDATIASRKILNGKSFVSGDFAAPPTPVLKQALSSKKDQLDIVPSGGNRFIALNTKVKPLDDVNVRKAIVAVTDRNELRLTRGGPTLGTVATHWIPPGIPGFEEAGGEAGTGVDFLKNPNGDLALAQEYLRKAGFASGKYSGKPLLMVGDDEAPANKTGEAFQAQLEKLGFKLTYRQVPHATMLSKFCGVPKAAVALCPNLGWGKDFYDSQSMVDPVFNGKNIVETGNANYAQLDDPELNAAMDKAETLTEVTARAKAWGEIDKRVTELAPVVPWLWDNQVNIRSSNVKGVVNAFNSSYDLTFSSLE
ncbi:MAG TPA: ABC transporter substrate-binding protein [Thermoleophilaceae bacterium]|jgi:peptide/nickel transport system substrate-binding protein